MIPNFPARNRDAHKGDYGRIAIIGGSRGMSGAVALAGMAALRSGAGLTTLLVPKSCHAIVAQFDPCYMTYPLPEDTDGRLASDAWEELSQPLATANAIACGPGLGRSVTIAQGIAELYRQATVPMVIDADALNALAANTLALKDPGGPRILTPHLGEFRRLSGEPTLTMEQAVAIAPAWSRHNNVITILKGHRTLVTDGTRCEHNETGNPGMATGGAGDVLTGITVALVARQHPEERFSPWEAARLATWVHGRAGDLASEQTGQTGLTARDIITSLPLVFHELERRASGTVVAS